MKEKHNPFIRAGFAASLVLVATGILLLGFTPSQAFQFEEGEVTGSLDTTVSYGASWRVQSRDKDLIGIANGGKAYSVNADDGNLNYDTGLISNVFKITSELELDYRNFSAFIRSTAFYDFENERSSRERTSLGSKALDEVGSDVDLLDAYVQGDFTIDDRPFQIRVGEQVVSWGESTFIQNSINVINPVNVAALRIPGSELREALVPEGMVWGALGLTDNTSMEAFYLYDWEETTIDPPGTYFSTTDFVGSGGNKVLLGWGDLPDSGTAPPDETFMAVPRGKSSKADNQGQFGVAFRFFAPGLNDTEFGIYYMNYHSRLPLISSTTGTAEGAAAAQTVSNATPSIFGAVDNHLASNPGDVTGAIVAGASAGVGAGASVQDSTLIAAAATLVPEDAEDAAGAIATDKYAKTARYRTEYPENIDLVGLSFNTMLGRTGIALQGEFSYRWDAPIQVDDVELLYATLGAIEEVVAENNQVGNYYGQFGTPIRGYILKDISQIQATATKIFGPMIGADQFALVGEIGMTHVHNMPSKSSFRMDGPGTFVSGNAVLGPVAHAGKPIESSGNFADATSWGYVLVGRLDFNNAIGAINLSPRAAWRHDVDGNSPGPGGNFLENRKAASFGLTATYQNSWSADVNYTNFFGAGRHNLVNDRDFISFNIKYSF